MAKSPKRLTSVLATKHEDKGANARTEELRDFAADDEKVPEKILCARNPSLDPQRPDAALKSDSLSVKLRHLHSKSLLLVCAFLTVFLFGCGNPERQAARQKFREDLAAIKVCAVAGSTYDEFRQAQIRLEYSFEANKHHLPELTGAFARLSLLMAACDHCWQHTIK